MITFKWHHKNHIWSLIKRELYSKNIYYTLILGMNSRKQLLIESVDQFRGFYIVVAFTYFFEFCGYKIELSFKRMCASTKLSKKYWCESTQSTQLVNCMILIVQFHSRKIVIPLPSDITSPNSLNVIALPIPQNSLNAL